ncbi:MAG TPA: hypothetical protein VGC11_17195 [Acidimicrobiia bacterium]|jgi:ABC-2 type transport system permease protein
MSLWRLEWLRLVRTRRWIGLVGVYVFFGFVGPLTARYLGEIVDFAGGELEGATIEFPPPVPADGLIQYVSNAMQIGTLVAAVIAAAALTIDAVPEIGVFFRTRVTPVSRILRPRLVVTAVVVVAAFVLGALVAWYETWALIGAPSAGGVLSGIGYGALFLGFVVTLVGAIAGRSRSVAGTVMVAIVILLLMPALGIIDAIGRWLPTRLAGALAALPAGDAAAVDYLGAAAITVAAGVLLVWLGARWTERREV